MKIIKDLYSTKNICCHIYNKLINLKMILIHIIVVLNNPTSLYLNTLRIVKMNFLIF